jgi:hypothetical protein
VRCMCGSEDWRKVEQGQERVEKRRLDGRGGGTREYNRSNIQYLFSFSFFLKKKKRRRRRKKKKKKKKQKGEVGEEYIKVGVESEAVLSSLAEIWRHVVCFSPSHLRRIILFSPFPS